MAPGAARAARPRDRVPRLRGRSGARVSAAGRAAAALPRAAGPGIRVDSGVEEGADVPVHYDPMLAKVIASAETRDAAIARAVGGAARFPDPRHRTNIPFLIERSSTSDVPRRANRTPASSTSTPSRWLERDARHRRCWPRRRWPRLRRMTRPAAARPTAVAAIRGDAARMGPLMRDECGVGPGRRRG